MQTIEQLRRKIASADDLKSIVRTMKVLAAVNIRQYEKAVDSLGDYNRTVEMGLQILVKSRPEIVATAREAPPAETLAVIFGSDQGMCGQFNEEISSFAFENLRKKNIPRDQRFLVPIGERVAAILENEKERVEKKYSLPGSVAAITHVVQQILIDIEEWNAKTGFQNVLLFFNKHLSGSSYKAEVIRILPIDRIWLLVLQQREWPSHMIPQFTAHWEKLFSSLLHQYLFVSLYRAFAESLASENASRLVAMQGAEQNIEEMLSGLNDQYHQRRQMTITEEILDIVSGFEALNG